MLKDLFDLPIRQGLPEELASAINDLRRRAAPDADAPPADTTVTLGLYEPGSPATLSGPTTGPDVTLTGDINGDGVVNILDLIEVVLAWGPCPAPPAACAADVDGNGMVDVIDLVELLLNWS